MSETTKSLLTLVVNRLSRKKYHELKETGGLKSDELYIITDDTLNAVGEVVSNVKTPTSGTDAANKSYVDDNAVSAFALGDHEYVKSDMSLEKVYDVVFDIVKILGGTVK